jgi:hypothetical protein
MADTAVKTKEENIMGKRVEEMVTCFSELTEEAGILKLVFGTILPMRAGIRHYPGCKSLDESFEASETLVNQRIAEIEASLKSLGEEGKKLNIFMQETPQGGIQ